MIRGGKRYRRAVRDAEDAASPRCVECQCVIYPEADGTPGETCKRCGHAQPVKAVAS